MSLAAVLRPGFMSERAYAPVFFATVAIWAILELRQSLNRRVGAQTEDRGSLVLVRLVSAGGAALGVLAQRFGFAAYPVTPVLFAAAIALIWSGIALRQWCFITLGRYFTFTVMTSPDQRVVSGGPYRYLRHPSYAALLLILIGIALTFGNWLSFASLVLIPTIGMVYRIRIEEAALSRVLGSAYTDFARSRKRIIPFVW